MSLSYAVSEHGRTVSTTLTPTQNAFHVSEKTEYLPTALTLIEQSTPRVYTRTLFCFPISEGASQDEIVKILQDSLESTKDTIPFLGAELVPDLDADQKGSLKLQYGDHGHITVKDLSSPGAFPFTYAELRAKGFPTRAFDSRILCPLDQLPCPGAALPVLAVQANFINGGLILCTCTHHTVIDSSCIYTIIKVWAAHSRHLQGLEKETPRFLPALIDRTSVRSSGKHAGRVEDHSQLTLLDQPPTAVPAGLTKTNHRTKVFHFSGASLSKLKAEVVAEVVSDLDEKTWISTSDVLHALIWRTIMKAMHGVEDSIDDRVSTQLIPVNARPRMSPPLPSDYLGACVPFTEARMDLIDVVSASWPLGKLALAVRRAINKMDGDYLDSFVAMLETVPDFGRLVPTSFGGLLDTTAATTSWNMFDMYSVDWGSKFGGICESIRPPYTGLLNGLQVISPPLPEKLGGGVEVVIGLEDQHLERLAGDDVWMRFAVPRE